jgi:hypothetical protein
LFSEKKEQATNLELNATAMKTNQPEAKRTEQTAQSSVVENIEQRA